MSNATYRVMIVDSDPVVRAFLAKRLRDEGHHGVVMAGTGAQAQDAAAWRLPDLVILDPALPDMDGLNLLARLRERTHAPVIVLSKRSDESYKVRVLDAGADDYVTKPFGTQELLARVRVHLRRAGLLASHMAGGAVVDLDELKVYVTERRVTRRGETVPLTRREWDLLRELAENADRVLSHRQLLLGAWGPAYADDECSLRTYIKQLRKKLEPDPTAPRYILNEPGMGYRLSTRARAKVVSPHAGSTPEPVGAV